MKAFFNNKYFQLLPEILMLIFVLFYWFSTSYLLNPVAIILTIVITFLLVTKNQITGIILGSVILLANLYLILALLSDVVNQKADFKLIVFGALFIGVGILISVWLIVKYAKLAQNSNFTVQEVNS